MKKNLLTCLASLALIVTGCKDNKHTHTYELKANEPWSWVAGDDAAWTSATATFTCNGCEETTADHTVTVDAVVTSEVTLAPTCETTGTEVYTATVEFEGKTYTDTKEETLDAIGHLASNEWSSDATNHWHACEHEMCIAHLDEEAHNLKQTWSSDSSQHWHECEVCGYKADLANHVFDRQIENENTKKSDPDCTHNAVYYKSCVCGAISQTETFEVEDSSLGHDMTLHQGTPATCQESGTLDYYTCSHEPGVLYKDEDGTETFTSLEETIVEDGPHDMTKHNATSPTCLEGGNLEYYTCSHEEGVYYKNVDGTEMFEDVSETEIAPLGHLYGQDGKCVREGCDSELKTALGLEDCDKEEKFTTLSDLGMDSPTNIKDLGGNHIFKDFDFENNETIDFRFNFKHNLDATGAHMYFYLGNKGNEDGLVIRVRSDRNDEYEYGQIYSSSASSQEVVVKESTGEVISHTPVEQLTFKPGVAPEEGRAFRVTMGLTDKATWTYIVIISMSADGGNTWYTPWSGKEEAKVEHQYFTVTFGAGYFNGQHNQIRFSNSNSSMVITNFVSKDSTVYVKNDDGAILGKKVNATEETPLFPLADTETKKFIGWFDENGEKVSALPITQGNHVITARFTEYSSNSHALSEFGGNFKDTNNAWYDVPKGENFGEVCSGLANDVDYHEVAFRLRPTFVTGDQYALLGFPYDAIDGDTRIAIRFSLNSNSWFWNSSSTSIGGAAENNGTKFTPTGLHWVSGKSYLVKLRITVLDEATEQYNFGFNFTSLADGSTTGWVSKDFSWNNKGKYGFSDVERNKLCFQGSVNGGGGYQVTDLF